MRDTAFGEGRLLLQVFRDGKEIDRREGHNTIVNTGKGIAANRLFADQSGATIRKFNWMQLGKSATAANSSQTNILTPLTTVAGTAVSSRRSTAQTMAMSGSRSAKWQHTWTAGEFSASGIVEAGMFNSKTIAAGSKSMLARFVFTAVNKTKADTLKITWVIKIN